MSVRAEHLYYKYPKTPEAVIQDLSFEAPDGMVTVLIGANGVGKSTLLKTMLGIVKGSGKTYFDGLDRDAMSSSELHKMLGYMTQEGALVNSLSVLNVVLLGRLQSLHLKVQDEDIEKAMTMLSLLHMEEFAQRPFYALSGGQRRMVDAAQTLVRDPRVLIMDEPTSNLDLVNELQMLELVREYTHQRNTATILTLHSLNTAARYADKLVLIKDGKVFCEGAPAEVITVDHIREAYGVNTRISTDENNIPMLHPIAPVNRTEYSFR